MPSSAVMRRCRKDGLHTKDRLSLLQIEMHTAQGALRVLILNKVDGQESTAMNIAWHYDLVVTTFSRLSTEWGKEKKKQKSIFDQVCILATPHTACSEF